LREPPAFATVAFARDAREYGVTAMAKSQDTKKEKKKPALKSAKEKRADKVAKKGGK
jgi:broad specificity polyphosphatase/5'/3'-nucleotidase SurE